MEELVAIIMGVQVEEVVDKAHEEKEEEIEILRGEHEVVMERREEVVREEGMAEIERIEKKHMDEIEMISSS